MNHPPRCKQGIWWTVTINSNEIGIRLSIINVPFQKTTSGTTFLKCESRFVQNLELVLDQLGSAGQGDNIQRAVGGFPGAERAGRQFVGRK